MIRACRIITISHCGVTQERLTDVPSASAADARRSRDVANRACAHRQLELPAIGVGFQMRTDALPCQRFLFEPRNHMQVGVEDLLTSHASAVPADVVSIGRELCVHRGLDLALFGRTKACASKCSSRSRAISRVADCVLCSRLSITSTPCLSSECRPALQTPSEPEARPPRSDWELGTRQTLGVGS